MNEFAKYVKGAWFPVAVMFVIKQLFKRLNRPQKMQLINFSVVCRPHKQFGLN